MSRDESDFDLVVVLCSVRVSVVSNVNFVWGLSFFKFCGNSLTLSRKAHVLFLRAPDIVLTQADEKERKL